MKYIFYIIVWAMSSLAFSQEAIEWTKDYKLQLTDFKSPATKIEKNTRPALAMPVGFDFQFGMSSLAFMAKKNFNADVVCLFKKEAASLSASDEVSAMELLHLAQYQFDLSELYARKTRKELYESKNAFSNIDFCKSIVEKYNNEVLVKISKVSNEVEWGKNKELLAQFHQEVLEEIENLSDFCKNCKPTKKKKAR